MDSDTNHYLDECARLGKLARDRKASADAQAEAASITINQLRSERDSLRARVAKLEAALRGVLYLAESACARTEVGWIATRSGDDWTDGIRAARAALGAKGE